MAAQPATLYEQLGGAAGISRLVEHFYDLVEQDVSARPLLNLHFDGHGIAHSRLEQTRFLTSFFGGPKIYAEHHGHFDIRAIHAHVPITAETRDIWVRTMDRTFDELDIAPALKQKAMRILTSVAHMLHDVNPFNAAAPAR